MSEIGRPPDPLALAMARAQRRAVRARELADTVHQALADLDESQAELAEHHVKFVVELSPELEAARGVLRNQPFWDRPATDPAPPLVRSWDRE
jgi:hypothetical protein